MALFNGFPLAPLSQNIGLVVANPKEERLLSDELGYEFANILVGPQKARFSVHRNLLVAASSVFKEHLDQVQPSPYQQHSLFLEDVDAGVFKLFVEYLYTRKTPGVPVGVAPNIQAIRLRSLLQLHTFVEDYDLSNEYRNKLLDAIQDGFVAIDKFPEPTLVSTIFQNTGPLSIVRKFVMACLIYQLRSIHRVDDGKLSAALTSNKELLDGFLIAVREFQPQGDPRIRHCNDDPRCVECAAQPGRLENLNGVEPCTYHIHFRMVTGPGGVASPQYDPSCHLWNSDP